MNLSEKQKRIISSVQYQGNVPLAQIAEETGYRPHVVRNTLDFLKEKGILTPCAFVDPKRLGLDQQAAYFSYLCDNEQERQKLHIFLRQFPQAAIVWEFTGEYQYQATIFADRMGVIDAFFGEISKNCRGHFQNKAVSMRKTWSLFRHKSLSDHPSALNSLDFGRDIPGEKLISLDELDRSILRQLTQSVLPSTMQVTRNLGLAKSTVVDRIKRLEEAGIICGYGYSLNASLCGIHGWRLIVWLKHCSDELCSDFYSFGQSHPNIKSIAYCVGSWDFELALRTENKKEISAIVQSIYSRYRENISSLKLLTVLGRIKFCMYPF